MRRDCDISVIEPLDPNGNTDVKGTCYRTQVTQQEVWAMGMRGRAALLFTCFCFGLAAAGHGSDDDHVARSGGIEIVHAWSRATDEDMGVMFMEIANHGSTNDRLVGARTPIAKQVELHGAVMREGRMTSEPLAELSLPPGAELELEPNGAFLRLIGLKQELIEGEDYVAAIEFAEAGLIEIDVQIEPADAMRHSHAGHAH
jgi:periplasmic copper chaperone A